MSNRCDITGKRPGFGNRVSHSHRRTRRRWNPNIQERRFYLPSQDRYIRLAVSAKALRTIDKQGIEAVAARLRAKGQKI